MIKLRKVFCLVLSVILTMCIICACGTSKVTKEAEIVENNVNNSENGAKKIKIVTTIFPIYDIVRNLVPNDNYEITLLLDSGIDIHNFSPTANDITTLSEADLFIYIGGESDNWVDKTLQSANNSKLMTLNIMASLASFVKDEEMIEGMQEEEHEHEVSEEHEEGHEHKGEKDEHIWLSLKNTKEMTKVIANKMMELDSTNKEQIESSAKNYISKLDELDRKYIKATNSKKFDTVLFGDRFPFRYLVDDYGIKYYAAFSGCSAEAEASFETVVFLAKKIDELGLTHVCALEGKEPKIANTIINASNDKHRDIVLFDSMEGVANVSDAENTNYLKIMERNLIALNKALN